MISTPQFTNSIASNVAYWRKRTQSLDANSYQELNQDRQNIYRAVEFGLASQETWHETVELALSLLDYFEKQGFWREWLPILQRISDDCPEDDLHLKSKILDQLGLFFRHNRQLDKALALHIEEERIGLALGDAYRVAKARMQQSGDYWRMRKYDSTEKAAKSALQGFNECGAGPWELGNATMMIGLVNQSRGNLEPAEEWLLQTIEYFQQAGTTVSRARALLNLGNILQNGRKWDRALACYNEALALLAETDNEVDRARLMRSIGTLYYHQDKLEEAEAAFKQANTPYMRRWGPIYDNAMTIMNLANIYLLQGRLDKAEEYWQNCIKLWHQVDANLMLANSLGGLAETLAAKGYIELSIPRFDQALTIIEQFPEDAWAQRLKTMFEEARAANLEKIERRPSNFTLDSRPHSLQKEFDLTD